jgi:hypothetical protein
MNNVWDTNFPASQSGEARLTYAIASAQPGGRGLAVETAAAVTQPLVAVLGATRDPPAGSICDVEAPGVEVVLLAPTDDGFAVHLQSYADEPVSVSVAGARVSVDAGDYVVVPVQRA